MNSLFSKYVIVIATMLVMFQTQLIGQRGDMTRVALPELAKITHFDKSDFKGDSQFWAMVRDSTGVYYFGNNDGALVYNGQEWKDVRLPNGSGVRSLLKASNGDIYAGGYNDFGVIKKDDLGAYAFKSISEDLKVDAQKLENVWQIHEVNGYVILRTFQGLIAVNNNISSFIPAAGSFVYSDVVNSEYYVQDEHSGIMSFDPVSKDFKLIFSEELFDNDAIVAFLPSDIENQIEVITKRGTIYLGDIKRGTLVKKHSIFSSTMTESLLACVKKDDDYILGTVGSKVLIFSEGTLINRNKSIYDQIQDQTVLNLYQDENDLWVLLNDGLDVITFDSFFSNLFAESSVYDILIKEEYIYIATNNGVYYSIIPDPNKEFNFIKTTLPQGQAWSLSDMGSSILVSHDLGLFELKGATVTKIGSQVGFWKVVAIAGENDMYLACSYNGFFLLKRSEEGFYFEAKIAGFEESTRDVLQADEKNTFWVCHGYKGVYRVRFSEDYLRVNAIDHYTDQNGLDSRLSVKAHRWNGDIVFSTNQGIYSFDKQESKFIPYPRLNEIIDTTVNTGLILEYDDTTWVILDDQIGYFDKSKEVPEIETNTFINLKGDLNRGFETIFPISKANVFVGAKSGLYVYDIAQSTTNLNFSTVITGIKKRENIGEPASQISLVSSGKIEVSPNMDMLRFEFASPKNTPATDIAYSYRLKNLDKEWSSWSENPFKEYTHLPAGEYVFSVRGRNERGVVGREAYFSFEVTTLWYQTILAKVVLAVLLVLLFMLGLKLVKNKLKEERRKAQELLERSKKVLNLQIEQLKLEQAKTRLEEDVILKSKELTNYTVQLINKKQAFIEMQNDLKELKGLVKNSESKRKLTEMFKKLHQHNIGEEYLQVYDVNFEKINNDFFQKLKDINSKITKRELRLCAFIKMNLTNKEIAPLLTISVRGVETARYRVRKKLNITHDGSFTEFLKNL